MPLMLTRVTIGRGNKYNVCNQTSKWQQQNTTEVPQLDQKLESVSEWEIIQIQPKWNKLPSETQAIIGKWKIHTRAFISTKQQTGNQQEM